MYATGDVIDEAEMTSLTSTRPGTYLLSDIHNSCDDMHQIVIVSVMKRILREFF